MDVQAAKVVIYPAVSHIAWSYEKQVPYHRPVPLHQVRLALKPVIQHGDEAPPDQKYYPCIIELIPKPRYFVRMVGYRVERCAHAQASGSTEEEAAKDPYVFASCSVPPTSEDLIQDDRGDEDGNGAEQMCIDVDGFVVQVSKTFERLAVRVGLWTVAGKYVVVVLLPSVDFVPEDGELVFDRSFHLFGSFNGVRDRFLCCVHGETKMTKMRQMPKEEV